MGYFEIILFIILLSSGFFFGQILEQQHYRSIYRREEKLRSIPVIASKKLPENFLPCDTKMVAGNVVISVDFFKKFVAGLRTLVGGRVTSYETLIDRARREAILRMKQQAQALNANMIWNVRLETSAISKSDAGGVGSIEMLAWGTALIIQSPDEIQR